MRMLAGFALLALGIAGTAPAQASDLVGHRHVYPRHVYPRHAEFAAIGKRAAPLVIYDYQPGVIVRAYWINPWRQRHYFPTTGKAPEVGRLEDLSPAARETPEPAESFYRSWSSAPLTVNDATPASMPSSEPELPPHTDRAPRLPDAMKP